jgi:glycyl-tRNA synthetase beta chain
VLTARLRDARFFWDEDRREPLAARVPRLATILFHKNLGSYREKADRVAALAAWIASEVFGRPEAAADAEQAGRLCKADLATDMVRELTELQGTMGGIYAREEGLPDPVWKAIYFHYLPVGVEADAAPSRQQLGPSTSPGASAAVVWAAVSLADKLDSVVGMFAAGERPTGSRDPLGLRRQAQGAVKILADLPELTGVTARVAMGPLLRRAGEPFDAPGAGTAAAAGEGAGDGRKAMLSFMSDRLAYLLEQRGFDVRAVRAVMHGGIEQVSPFEARRKLEALAQMTGSEALLGVATLLKRVKNITKGVAAPESLAAVHPVLTEPAERSLAEALETRAPVIRAAAERGDYREAFAGIAQLQPAVAKFFDDVLVMAEDAGVRAARLGLVASLRDLILGIADISEIVTES